MLSRFRQPPTYVKLPSPIWFQLDLPQTDCAFEADDLDAVEHSGATERLAGDVVLGVSPAAVDDRERTGRRPSVVVEQRSREAQPVAIVPQIGQVLVHGRVAQRQRIAAIGTQHQVRAGVC